ncbi:hypothetical protein A7W90_13240 [Clostridium sp. Bc-iso-3]|nr:hypothetical protein A7W90_13240 [Clostridium sp. Bc-iso-3]
MGTLHKIPYDFDREKNDYISNKILADKLDLTIESIKELARIQHNKVVYVNAVDDTIISEKELILRKLNRLTSDLTAQYENEIDRLEIFCLLKENIKKLKKLTNKQANKYYFRSCIVIHDAIMHIKSESLSFEQVQALTYVISKLSQESIDKSECYEIDSILYSKGLDCIPDLDEEE